jgi:hypothetical protein
MAEMLPITVKSSKLLSILYVYAKNLQMEDDELTNTENDQNIITCRAENIQQIWGDRLGQILTSDFDIDTYRQLLLSLVRISLTDSVTQNIKNTVNAYFPLAQVDVYEYWQDPSLLFGYDWQNKSFLFRGVGDTQISGNSWNDTRPWVDNLHTLGFFLFGVQIHLRNLTAEDVEQIEAYVIPSLDTFVRPAGVYYKTIVLDITMDAADRAQVSNGAREVEFLYSITGFGLLPFGRPTPVLPSDAGFGSPTRLATDDYS